MRPDPMLTRRGLAPAPETLDRGARTVEVVLSTGAAVPRAGFLERLSLAPGAVEVAARVPLLDTHRQGSIRDILGRVSGIRHEPGRIVATLHVTSDAALDAIGRGDVSGVSIGYRVAAWAEGRDPATGQRTRTATRWTLLEASLVAVPADAGALVRSSSVPEAEAETEAAPPRAETQTRARDIRALSVRANLPAAWADEQIDRDATVEEACAAALDAILARPAPAIRTQQAAASPSGDDDTAHRMEALAHRMAPGVAPLSEGARRYRHHRAADHARDILQMRGESVTGLSADQIIARAMTAVHTVSDFPGLLAGAGSRVLAPAYEAALSPLRGLFRQSTAPDFRAKTRLALSEMPLLLKTNEGGEIKHGTRGETAEIYRLETYARLFALSRQALVNDDLGAFADWTQAMAAAAAETENTLRAELLTQAGGLGPVMADGKRLFHAGHGNLANPAVADGGVLTVGGLSAARFAMRTQKGLDGKTPIGAVPKYLLVSPELETRAEQVLAELAAAAPEGVNPFSGRLALLVEPRLTGAGWYLFADPAARPVFEQAHLSSAPGPQLSSREGWDVLAAEFRVVLDFGAGAVDWRGAYHNPGRA